MSDEQQQNDTPDTLNARLGALSPKQKKFLKAYGDCGVVKYACKIAGIHRSTFYDWRDRDENFKACLPDTEEDANDTLEYAAYVQSVLGMEEYVVSAGKQVFDSNGKPLKIYKYSPQLLITLLKARMPHKYKDKAQLEHTGKDGGPIQNFQVHVFVPDDEPQHESKE